MFLCEGTLPLPLVRDKQDRCWDVGLIDRVDDRLQSDGPQHPSGRMVGEMGAECAGLRANSMFAPLRQGFWPCTNRNDTLPPPQLLPSALSDSSQEPRETNHVKQQ